MHTIRIFDTVVKKQENFWNNIHFHPTDAIEDEWGQRILNEVAKDHVAQTVRMYAMLADIVSMDENGKLQYDFTENDVRMDYMVEKGFQLLISYNFIPPCIAKNTEVFSVAAKGKTRYKGKVIIPSPPKDYALWEDICYEYTKHIVGRYGVERVKDWYLQCYNEPDIPTFFMPYLKPEEKGERLKEYCKLYHGFASGVTRAHVGLRLGGPAIGENVEFLQGFLHYVKENHVPMTYLSVHCYGVGMPGLRDGLTHLDPMNHVVKNKKYREILDAFFPGKIEMVVDEWGACTEGCFNVDECPKFMYRENEKFAAYYGKMITYCIEQDAAPTKTMICLSGQHEMTVDFSGFRNFFTLNFIKKPIYNAFVLGARLKKNVLKWEGEAENLSVLPTRDEEGRHGVMLSYAAPDFEQEIESFHGTLAFENVYGQKHVKVWAIDESHTNPYGLYLKNGYSPNLTKEQIEVLREEGNIKPVKEYDCEASGTLSIDVSCEGSGLLLVEF